MSVRRYLGIHQNSPDFFSRLEQAEEVTEALASVTLPDGWYHTSAKMEAGEVLSEPTIGILREQLASRRFLLRGLANVRAPKQLLHRG